MATVFVMVSDASCSRLVAAENTYAVIGAFFDVYNELGPGFPEFIARRALAIAIREAGLAAYEEVELPVWFRGQRLAKFKADIVVESKLLVEVKASPEIDRFHIAQVLHYLKATDLEVGLLVNIGREPQFKRIVYQNSRKRGHFEPPAPAELERALRADEIEGRSMNGRIFCACGGPPEWTAAPIRVPRTGTDLRG